jgi:hypothetical protein
MTTQPASTGAAVPVACSLGPAGLATQAQRWERLAALAMISRDNTAGGLRISFRTEPGAEDELRALAAIETECCPWATWTVRTGDGELILDVRSASADGVAALHGMFGC